MKPEAESIELTVIVASVSSESDLKRCLASIFANEASAYELIVTGNCPSDLNTLATTGGPAIQSVSLKANTSLPVLLAAGIKSARGKIVAITDSTCVVADDWTEKTLQAHLEGPRIVGGSVEPGYFETSMDWAAYFRDYAAFMLPANPGPAGAVPGNNLSITSELFQSDSAHFDGEFWKTLWCEEQRALGTSLEIEPTITVRCMKTYALSALLSKRFQEGRCFAGLRVKSKAFKTRLIFAFAAPILPFVFLFRTIRTVVEKKRFKREFVVSLPALFLSDSYWAAGEFLGYLAGAGTACEKPAK